MLTGRYLQVQAFVGTVQSALTKTVSQKPVGVLAHREASSKIGGTTWVRIGQDNSSVVMQTELVCIGKCSRASAVTFSKCKLLSALSALTKTVSHKPVVVLVHKEAPSKIERTGQENSSGVMQTELVCIGKCKQM